MSKQVQKQRGKTRQRFLLENIKKDDLYNYYVNHQYSANHIAIVIYKHLNITASTIITLLKNFDIPCRNIKETSNLKNVRQKYRNTCQNKYGVQNISQSGKIQRKKEKTFLKHYGVKNGFSSDIIKNKIRETLLKKYGVEHIIYSDHYWKKQKKSFHVSKPHKKLENILKESNITCISEARNLFTKYNMVLEKIYSPVPDILIKDKKIVVEMYGNMFHANPNIYKPNDIIITWRGKVKAKDIWLHDEIRKQHIEDFGYKVLVVWEDDLENTNKINEIIKEIKDSN